MSTIVIRAALFVVLVIQAACLAIPMGKRAPTRPESRDPESPTAHGITRGDPPLFAPKPVAGKQPPSLLLARDGTQCAVSDDKYERTVIGTSVWCVWTEAGE